MKLLVAIEGSDGFPPEILAELWERMDDALKDLVFSAHIGSVLDSVYKIGAEAMERARELNDQGKLTDVIIPIESDLNYVMVNTLEIERVGRTR
jgi:hypothetical protein